MNEDAPRPKITLDFKAAWCAKHAERFRLRWPQGVPQAMLGIINAATQLPEIQEACGKLENGKYDSTQLNRVLNEFGPLCCLVGDKIADEIYSLAFVGAVWNKKNDG